MVLGGAVETGAEFGESHHRLNYVQNIALQKQLTAWLECRCDGQKQRGLQDTTLVVPAFEPGIGELDRDPLQSVLLQGFHPAFQADVGVAEQDPNIAVLRGERELIGRRHQRSADFNAEMIPVGITLGQAQQAPSTGTADIKVDRLIRNAKQLLGWW